MELKDLVKIEIVLIFLVIGSLSFVAGKTITGMVTHKVETPEDAFGQIRSGMTRSEVIEIAGGPLDKDKTEVWYYDDLEVRFENGIVTSRRRR